jgi:KipI family sensor histidine kinase inhibitor
VAVIYGYGSTVRLLRYGGTGMLIEFSSSQEVTSAYRALLAASREGELPGVAELVPAARTVLLTVSADVEMPLDTLAAVLAAPSTGEPLDAVDRPETVIPVRYDGDDLQLVAETASLSVPEVIELHAGARYTVAFCGFAPGFGYLTGLPEPLHQARLDSPRPKVPAGSVGIAGEYSAVYPRSSPGGWRLIGRTDEVLFDPSSEPPSRLLPGDRVRFEPITS